MFNVNWFHKLLGNLGEKSHIRKSSKEITHNSNIETVVCDYSPGGLQYDAWSQNQSKGLRQQEIVLIQTHCPNVNANICTLGCGSGRETFGLYNMGYHKIKGVDCSSAMLEIAQCYNEELGLNIQFDTATADNLQYPSKIFDVVTMFENVYGHITPRSVRLRSLAEVCRVVKPGRYILITATNIYHKWRFFLFIKMLEIFRLFYNPNKMELGDKKLRGASKKRDAVPIELPRTHWFRSNEIPNDAQHLGLSVIQQTTVAAVCRKPKENSNKLHRQGRFVYVLQRPA